MRVNKSPWIHQLDKDREITHLNRDIETDVTIVGAGIAGISTAFFVLKYTQERVVVCDSGRLAHGATGHNAGQVIARFERPLESIVEEFGFEKTQRALHDLNSGWMLLDEMYTTANLDVLLSRVAGHLGLSNLDQVILALKDLEIERRSGFTPNPILINEDAPFRASLPKVFEKLFRFVPHKEVLRLLETNDTRYNAVSTSQVACMNSALFCQEIVAYLIEKFPTRFSLYEETHITKTVLKHNHALLDAGRFTINTGRVVLCTNGFENIDILNEGGLDIDKRFHHVVHGTVGYMSAYLEPMNKPPTAIAYYGNSDSFDESSPYFYLTRRSHDVDGDKGKNLICVGGPEVSIEDREEYIYDYDYPEKMHQDIDAFIQKTYNPDPNRKIDYQFTWHGLMGYTPNRIRIIGAEPKNTVLLYNLGCNGIGIIPSIFGGRKISRIIAREKLPPSIFDPRVDDRG